MPSPGGNTTAKLSLLQGTTLSSLIRYHFERVAAAYVEGNREAFAWVLRYCDTLLSTAP